MKYGKLDLTTEHWTGVIIPEDENDVVAYKDGKPVALKHTYGKGESLWFPSMIDIGSRITADDVNIAEFYRIACTDTVMDAEFSFDNVYPDVFCRVLKNENDYMLFVVNKSSKSQTVKINGIPKNPVIIDGNGTISRKGITLPADGFVVLSF